MNAKISQSNARSYTFLDRFIPTISDQQTRTNDNSGLFKYKRLVRAISMPFTPFHFGPALLFGLLFLSYLDLPTMIVASIAVDIEPAIAAIFGLSYPGYGWFHTIGGSIVAVAIVVIVMYSGRKATARIVRVFRFEEQTSFKKILAASLLGVCFHLLIDAPLHALPSQDMVSVALTPIGLATYGFSTSSFVAGLVLYQHKLRNRSSY